MAKQRAGRTAPPLDPEEAQALRGAAEELTKHARDVARDPELVAECVITRWIMERCVITTKKRTGEILFDLKNAKLRGAFSALLPQLGAALVDLPADVPFWELEKDQVLDIFVAGYQAAMAARIAVLELDDPIPF